MKTQSKWLKQTNTLNKAIKSKRIEQLKKAISDAEQQGMPANNMSLFLAKKQLFLSYVKKNKSAYPISKKKDGEFRIATYNIHYFTDVYENKSTYNNIINDIKHLNSDIIGLQEFVLGNNIKINKNVKVDTRHFFDDINKLGYKKTVVCNSVPAWYASIYGNILLIKDTYCQDIECERNNSPLEESIYTFKNAEKTTICSGNQKGRKETRCYIKIIVNIFNKHIVIYNTHLDVASEKERLAQIKHIISDSKQYNKSNFIVFITGDLNTFDHNQENTKDKHMCWKTNKFLKDNGKVIAELKKHKFYDTHYTFNKKYPENMTTWNNTRVDFIFCNKSIKKTNLIIRPEYLYTDSSDHIPVVITLSKKKYSKASHRGSSRKARKTRKYK